MTIIVNNSYLASVMQMVSTFDSSTIANNKLKVYKGTMPADADSYDPVSATYTVDELATFTNWSIVRVGQIVKFTPGTGLPNPATVNATGTGTATWWAMYGSNDAKNMLSDGIGTVGGGSVSLVIDSLSLTSGNPVTIIDWQIQLLNPA